MEGGPNSNGSDGGDSDMMEFGENNSSNGLSSSALMMMPLMNSGASTADHFINRQFLPLPLNNNNSNQQQTGPSCGMKAKIMAHPLFPRLLAAYVNCQKVMEIKNHYFKSG